MPKLTLDFEFDDDNGLFAPTSTEMIFVYQSVMNEIKLSETLYNCMLPMWPNGQRKGDTKLTLAALSPLAGLYSWKWDAFDIWRKRFKRDSLVPASWAWADDEAKSWPNPWHAKRMLLLHDTLSSAVRSRSEFLKWQAPHRIGKEWEFEHSPCPVEAVVAKEYAGTLSLADWSTWPPFYPGDRSRLGLKLPKPRRLRALDAPDQG